jgi:hypothetical protein
MSNFSEKFANRYGEPYKLMKILSIFRFFQFFQDIQSGNSTRTYAGFAMVSGRFHLYTKVKKKYIGS